MFCLTFNSQPPRPTRNPYRISYITRYIEYRRQQSGWTIFISPTTLHITLLCEVWWYCGMIYISDINILFLSSNQSADSLSGSGSPSASSPASGSGSAPASSWTALEISQLKRGRTGRGQLRLTSLLRDAQSQPGEVGDQQQRCLSRRTGAGPGPGRSAGRTAWRRDHRGKEVKLAS